MRFGLIALFLASTAYGEAGRTAAQFLTRPAGARPFAMGQAFVAVGGDINALNYNPAGVAGLEQPVMTTMLANGFAQDAQGFLGYAHPTAIGTFAAGVTYYDGGSIGLNLTSGLQEQRKVEQDYAVAAAYALELLPGLTVGGAIKTIQLKLVEQYKADTQALDAGVQWRTPVRGLTLGGSMQHMGDDVTFEQDGDPLPRTWRAGAAYQVHLKDRPEVSARQSVFDVVETGSWDDVSDMAFLLTADAVQVKYQDMETRLGLEIRSMPKPRTGDDAPGAVAAFRAGYALGRDIDSVSLGFGFSWRRLSLDYAIGLVKEMNNLHRLSLAYRF